MVDLTGLWAPPYYCVLFSYYSVFLTYYTISLSYHNALTLPPPTMRSHCLPPPTVHSHCLLLLPCTHNVRFPAYQKGCTIMVLQTMVTSLLLYQTPNLLVIYGQYNTDNYTVACTICGSLVPRLHPSCYAREQSSNYWSFLLEGAKILVNDQSDRSIPQFHMICHVTITITMAYTESVEKCDLASNW